MRIAHNRAHERPPSQGAGPFGEIRHALRILRHLDDIRIEKTTRVLRTYRYVDSHSPWRMTMPLAVALQNLIKMADGFFSYLWRILEPYGCARIGSRSVTAPLLEGRVTGCIGRATWCCSLFRVIGTVKGCVP
jgi:hypothetical protein